MRMSRRCPQFARVHVHLYVCAIIPVAAVELLFPLNVGLDLEDLLVQYVQSEDRNIKYCSRMHAYQLVSVGEKL